MKPEIDILLYIDDYLNDHLDDAAKTAFENRLSSDTAFNELFEEQLMINEAIHLASLSQLSNQIGKDIKNIPYKKGGNTAKYIVGLSLVTLIGGASFLFLNKSKDTKKTSVSTISKTKEVSAKKNQEVLEEKTESLSTYNETQKTSIVKSKETKLVEAKKENISTEEVKNIIEKESKKSETAIQLPSTEKTNLDAPAEENAKIVCNNKLIISNEASCKNASNGSISAKLENKGEALFTIPSLNKSSKNGTFRDLEAGNYQINTVDEFKCTYSQKVSISEKWCPQNKSFSFAPEFGTKWNIIYEEGDQGTYAIYDQSLHIVKNGTFGTENINWDGKSNNYEKLAQGIYLAIINYSDGRKERVDLTIIEN